MPDKFDNYCLKKRARLRRDKDCFTLYDGYPGSGKSNASIWDALGTSRELFKIEEHICFDPEEYLRLIDDTPRYGSLILDEGGEAFNSRTFRNEMNIAIAKGLQQQRDRNLNVMINAPHKDYIDLVGRSRIVHWQHMDDAQTGRAEFMMPSRSKYYSGDEPYWKTLFFYQFIKLPTSIYERYRVIKTTKAKERLARYIDEIEAKRGKVEDNKPTPDDIVSKIKGMENKNSLQNSKGKFDSNLVRFEFGISEAMARVVVSKLAAES